ncbi:MAG: shikimate dehydrogenase [Pseudomonadota bacterium]
MTDRYAVLGDPISASLSPAIHMAWIRDARLDATYTAMRVEAGRLVDLLSAFRDEGGRGANVTLPLKEEAWALSTNLSDTARAIGAVNTLRLDSNKVIHGDNTDAVGFASDFQDQAGEPDRDSKLVMIGAGGAARAVVYALGKSGYRLAICNRTLSRAKALERIYSATTPEQTARVTSHPIEDLPALLEWADIVINATSLGHSGQSLPWPSGRDRFVYDLSYGTAASAFLAPAQTAGWRTADGLGMLVGQAAASFDIWFGIKPDVRRGFEAAEAILKDRNQ